MAVEHLIKSGMRDIAFLFGQMEASSAISLRYEGYKAALRDNNIKYREELVITGNWSFEGGISATEELLSKEVREFGIEAVKTILRIIYTKRDKLLEKNFEPVLAIRNTTRN